MVVLSKMGSFQWPELYADSFKLLQNESLVQKYMCSVEAQEKRNTENWNTGQNKIKLVP